MVTYRLANQADYENINAFYNRIYSTNRTTEQFLWEFHNGACGPSIYVIAEDNGKVVGTNCVIPIDLVCSDGKIIRSGKSEDTLVDPDYRGQNIFYNIYEFLFEKSREAGIQVIWGFTPARKPFMKLGFEIPYDHEQCLAVNHILRSYRYLSKLNPGNKALDKLKIFGVCVLSKLRTIGRYHSVKMNYRVVENPITEGVDELICANLSRGDKFFAIRQTPAFQDWRIYQNTFFHRVHTFGFYNEKNALIALIVFSSHKNKTAYFCQTTFHPDMAPGERVKVMKYATGQLFKQGIALVRNWVFDTNLLNREEIPVHTSAGYIHLKRGVGFVWKKLQEVSVDPQNFYLSRISTQGTT